MPPCSYQQSALIWKYGMDFKQEGNSKDLLFQSIFEITIALFPDKHLGI